MNSLYWFNFFQNPHEAIIDENDDMHVERIYCNHLYHLKCLLDYMKTPPFKGMSGSHKWNVLNRYENLI